MGDEELAAVIQAVRDKARAAAGNGSTGLDGVFAPDLMALVHARDAAEAKVAAIGTVNPRPPGLKNAIAQKLKRLVARALDWHVREQVEFNRAMIGCVQANMEAIRELSRATTALAAHHRQLQEDVRRFAEETYTREHQIRDDFASPIQELLDVRKHWAEWRVGFEDARNKSEIHILRTVSELQAAFQHRVTLLEESFRKAVDAQHDNFTVATANSIREVQELLWKDVIRMRGEFEALLYRELRVLRQKASMPQLSAAAQPAEHHSPPSTPPPIDWMRFADHFRGPEDDIRERQKHHAARFAGIDHPILDLGCGRGEFLEAARDAGLNARGVDQSAECVAFCRSKGLAVDEADLFVYLESVTDQSLGGIFCSQVVEHLPPERVPVLVRLMAPKLREGGLIAIETPNPECLAIFATHFYIDPTHTRPVPSSLLSFYLNETGFGSIEVETLAPAADAIPALKELPPAVTKALFGGLDYAIFARKL